MSYSHVVEPFKKALTEVPVHYTNAQALLGNAIDVLFRKALVRTQFDAIKERIQTAVLVLGLRTKRASKTPSKNKAWYIASSNREHFLAFMRPIKDADPSRLIIGHEGHIELDWTTEYIHPKTTGMFRKWLFSEWKTTKSGTKQVYNQFGLTKEMSSTLDHTLKLGVYRFINALNWIEALQPQNILTEYDREFKTTTWISAANHMKVPTFTMVHGSTYPIVNYVPTTAKTVLAWGEKQVNHFVESGLSDQSVKPAGNTRAEDQIKDDKTEIRKRLDLPLTEPMAVLISNNISIDQRLKLASCFASGPKDGLTRVVKLHPREHPDDYAGLSREELDALTFITSDRCSAEEAIAMGDVFVGHNSVMLLECVMMGKPIMVLDIISMNPGIGIELAKEGGFPLIQNLNQWNQEIAEMTDNEKRTNLVQNAHQLVSAHCTRRGLDAARWMVEFMRENT